MKAVSLEEPDTQDTIIIYLLLANNFGEQPGFMDELEALSEISNHTAAESYVLQKIYSEMNTWHEEQTRLQPTAIAEYGFNPSTILQMIEANLSAHSVDESFFDNLTNAYLISPSLFSETIATLSENDIQFLAKIVSYSLQKSGRIDQAVMPDDCNTPMASAVAKLIYDEVVYAEALSITDFVSFYEMVDLESIEQTEQIEDIAEGTIEPLQLGDFYIYSIGLSTNNVNQYSTVSAEISFGTDTVYTTAQTFTIKVYSSSSPETPIASRVARIPARSTGTTAYIPIPMNNPGSHSLVFRIYDSNGTLLVSGTSGVITVTGLWSVLVILPQNRNNTGVIYLYNAYGTLICQHECLGRSVSGDDPMVTNGNTPTGTGDAWLEGPHQGYGPHKVIATRPTSGQLLTSGRVAILVHGGSGEFLDFTDGCIRVKDSSMANLQDKIENLINAQSHAITGTINILEQ